MKPYVFNPAVFSCCTLLLYSPAIPPSCIVYGSRINISCHILKYRRHNMDIEIQQTRLEYFRNKLHNLSSELNDKILDKLDLWFVLYYTACQQTLPESQLLEAWPASIYGRLREGQLTRKGSFVLFTAQRNSSSYQPLSYIILKVKWSV